jgi:gliding motility-associated-like protein/CSLREA domain-containing protein
MIRLPTTSDICKRTFFLLVWCIIGVSAANAQFVVDTSDDAIDINPGDGICANENGDCSLRAAIMEANSTGAASDIFIPNGEYIIALGVTLENGCISGDLDITSDVVIHGESTRETIINADSLDRVFHILPGVLVNLEYLELHQGYVLSDDGGAILNEGELHLFHIAIRASMAEGDVEGQQGGGMGGAIYNDGIITIENTTINDCMSRGGEGGNGIAPGGGSGGGGGPGFGGAIFNDADAICVILNSTLSGNIAVGGRGGGGTHHQGSGVVSSPGGAGGGAGGAAGGQGGNGGAGNWAGGGGGGGSLLGAGGAGGFGGGGGGGGANSWSGNSGPGGDGGLYGGDGGQGCCSGGSGGGGGGALGGGVFNNSGDVTCTNCTFAFNEAIGGNGGNGWFSGPGNSGMGVGGGVFNLGGAFILNNCLAAENLSSNSGEQLAGEIGSVGGHNLVQTTDVDVTFVGVTTGDLLDINPFLYTLSDNGGNTDTHMMESCTPASPAIDAGNDNFASEFDQIGQEREGVSEIGALEVLAPSATLLPMDTVLCFGQTLILDVTTQGAIYNWDNGSTDPILLVEAEDIYGVTVSIDGCDFSDDISVEFSPLETVDLGEDQTLCFEDVLILESDILGDSYLWHDGSTLPTYTPDSSGVYSVLVTLGNCSASDTILIDQVAYVALELGDDLTICEGEQAVFSTDVLADQFTWNTGQTNPSITVSTSGDYILNAEIDGCHFTESVALDVVPLPLFNLGSDTQICHGETLMLDVSNIGETYVWQDGSTGGTYTVYQTGVYSVEVYQDGCDYMDEISVIVNPVPSFNLGPDVIICHNDNVQIQAFVSSPGASVLWSTGENTEAISPVTTGIYTATSYLNDCVFSDEIYVEVIPTFHLHLGEDMVLCDGLTYVLDAWDESFTFPLQIDWHDAVTDSIRTVTETGLYQVEVLSTCESKTDEIYMEFELCDCRVYIPNTFTPDNDGINDVFEVSSSKCYFETYSFWIMDRNGEIVFTTQSPGSQWNGSYQDGFHYVADGIYAWRILYTFKDSQGVKSEEKFGHVTVIR